VGSEKLHRPGGEIGIVEPAEVDHDPVDVILEQLIDHPRDTALRRCEAGVEVDAIAAFEVQPDQRRIRHDRAVVVEIGQLALGRPPQTALLDAERQARHVKRRPQSRANPRYLEL